MKTQKFGIEIEMTGLTRSAAATVIAKHFGTTVSFEGGGYDTRTVADGTGRKWKIVSDSSIRAAKKGGGYAGDEYKVEMVSPICTYADIETVQEIVRQLRHKGAMVNDSCGIHVHIDAAAHTARSLWNLANIMASKENLLFKAVGVKSNREGYCEKVDRTFLEKLNKAKPKDKSKIKTLWYNGNDGSNNHYDGSRYRALNLHSVWQKGTVEFRLYNSSLHAGEIKSYIQLSLAINRQALTQTCASYRTTETTNDKYTFRTWLLRLGLIGDEFETARHHLLKNLSGDIAFRDNRRAA
ncbi:hypothetical protein FACS1894211_00440 [Clostridia bacterium]|nr:hypothetical protein FACS1894211_00440 [Clostridia bacterium]